jgi:hypothetical protein
MLSHRHADPAGAPSIDERHVLNVIAAEEARRAERALRPPLGARIAARLLATRLDCALIAGADPARSPLLSARAATLTKRSTRAQLADTLDLIVAGAQQPPVRSRVRPRHSSVLANAPLLRELALTLRGPEPLYAPGIAMVRLLLTDGTGPLYTSRDGTALERELRRARAAVCG